LMNATDLGVRVVMLLLRGRQLLQVFLNLGQQSFRFE
jgi:hypothetical protein